jgi:hypothetical protein
MPEKDTCIVSAGDELQQRIITQSNRDIPDCRLYYDISDKVLNRENTRKAMEKSAQLALSRSVSKYRPWLLSELIKLCCLYIKLINAG